MTDRWLTCAKCGKRYPDRYGGHAVCRTETAPGFPRLKPEKPARKRKPSEAKANRDLALRRAQGRCEMTGTTGRCREVATEVHHLVPRSRGGNDDPDNTLALCHPCHARIHANPQWATEMGYLR